MRCETCSRPLTGNWSKGRSGHYAYYHCQRQCRAVNVAKSKLEGLFVDELVLLQATSGYMRLVKDRVLHVWQQLRSDVKERAAEIERRVKAIQRKLDRLALEEFDVEGILCFAERVLPRASDLWVQASLNQKQRLQQLFFRVRRKSI